MGGCNNRITFTAHIMVCGLPASARDVLEQVEATKGNGGSDLPRDSAQLKIRQSSRNSARSAWRITIRHPSCGWFLHHGKRGSDSGSLVQTDRYGSPILTGLLLLLATSNSKSTDSWASDITQRTIDARNQRTDGDQTKLRHRTCQFARVARTPRSAYVTLREQCSPAYRILGGL